MLEWPIIFSILGQAETRPRLGIESLRPRDRLLGIGSEVWIEISQDRRASRFGDARKAKTAGDDFDQSLEVNWPFNLNDFRKCGSNHLARLHTGQLMQHLNFAETPSGI